MPAVEGGPAVTFVLVVGADLFRRIAQAFVATLKMFQVIVRGWGRSDAPVYAAAIAYSALFSLAPLVVLIFNILGQRADRSTMVTAIEDAVPGPAGAALGQLTDQILLNAGSTTANWIVTSISVVILFWGSSTLFLQLRRSLNRMYNLAPRPATVPRSLFNHLFDRLMGAAIVLGVGLSFVLLFVLSAGFGAYAGNQRTLVNLAGSYLANVAVFALLYKFLPQAGVRWLDVLPGALLTALLYWIGNIAVGVYFYFARTAVHYGSASIVIVVLFWVYVMSIIVLFGAKFTEVYARTRGRPVRPDSSMLSIPLDKIFEE